MTVSSATLTSQAGRLLLLCSKACFDQESTQATIFARDSLTVADNVLVLSGIRFQNCLSSFLQNGTDAMAGLLGSKWFEIGYNINKLKSGEDGSSADTEEKKKEDSDQKEEGSPLPRAAPRDAGRASEAVC